jgi:hypothetical protein
MLAQHDKNDAIKRHVKGYAKRGTLDGATLVPEIRKPFDVLAEGLLSTNSRDNRTAIELFSSPLGEWTQPLIDIAQALAS